MRSADRSVISVSNWTRSSAAVPRSDDELAIVASIIAAAEVARLAQPKVMNFLTALDKDVEIVITQKPRSRRAARTSVVAA